MFQEIKDAVSVREAASFYGLKVTRGGMVCCPFHNDRTPSMKVDGRFHCFGCGADGDVISFVQKMFDLDSKKAAFRLIDDFHLNIDINRKESRHEKEQRIRMQKKKEREEKIRAAYAGELRRFQLRMTEIYRTLHEWEIEHQPTREQWEGDRVDERYICAVHNKDPVGWILDTIDFGEDNDKFEYFKHREEIIDFYERKIAEADRSAAGRRGKGAASDTGA